MQCVRFNFIFFILIISIALDFAQYCISKTIRVLDFHEFTAPDFSLSRCHCLTTILEEKFYYE